MKLFDRTQSLFDVYVNCMNIYSRYDIGYKRKFIGYFLAFYVGYVVKLISDTRSLDRLAISLINLYTACEKPEPTVPFSIMINDDAKVNVLLRDEETIILIKLRLKDGISTCTIAGDTIDIDVNRVDTVLSYNICKNAEVDKTVNKLLDANKDILYNYAIQYILHKIH